MEPLSIEENHKRGMNQSHGFVAGLEVVPLGGLVTLLNARTDRASQRDNHCFRLRQPVSLAIVKRVP
jgi:hypothetical protein